MGSNDFDLWKMKMKVVLVKEGLDVALEGEENLPETMDVREKKELLKKTKKKMRKRMRTMLR